jgi:hypothetical protein
MSRIRSALYAQCIDWKLDALSGGTSSYYLLRGRPDLSSQSATTLISDLCNDLSAYWQHLDAQMQQRLLQYLDYEQSEDGRLRFFLK